ncbi:hypothetical protein HPB50_011893 [Hyalomma asiaticum]|uniref:Uncharacterized protein n=1 Tax=Hyalomma asiaticum TaxID=266040 RepID=A0ACB7T4T2_HYAAI|nr:hypothetical protein HPB50_011893 [Hyalomma asiaticum]
MAVVPITHIARWRPTDHGDTQRTKTKRLTNVFIEPAASVFLESRTTRFGYFDVSGSGSSGCSLKLLKLSASELHRDRLLETLERLRVGPEGRARAIEELSALERVELVNNDPVACAIYTHRIFDVIMNILGFVGVHSAHRTALRNQPKKQLSQRAHARECEKGAHARFIVQLSNETTEGKRASAQTAWRGGGDRRVRVRVIAQAA